MTPQKQMQTKLAALGIPHHEVKCFGGFIHVIVQGEKSADKWCDTLENFSTVKHRARMRFNLRHEYGGKTPILIIAEVTG